MEDVFERRKKGRGVIFFIYFFYLKVVVKTKFFSWLELLPNMSGMQSFKVLLLFVKKQCRFSPPLHHHQSCVLIPLLFQSKQRNMILLSKTCVSVPLPHGWLILCVPPLYSNTVIDYITSQRLRRAAPNQFLSQVIAISLFSNYQSRLCKVYGLFPRCRIV